MLISPTFLSLSPPTAGESTANMYKLLWKVVWTQKPVVYYYISVMKDYNYGPTTAAKGDMVFDYLQRYE